MDGLRNSVATVNAPAGAITDQAELEKHLKSGLRLYEGICGCVRSLTHGSDWVIQSHRLVPTSLFLYPNKQAAEDDVECLGALPDRHIGSEGYNDNWWFSSLEAAQAYEQDRLAAREAK